MARTKAFPHELIGEEVVVVEATNESLRGMQGVVVDETKNMISLELHGERKNVLKRGIVLKLLRTGELVRGEELTRRSEDRLKG